MSENREYKIKVKICSEAIFNSGEKERNLVQSKVLTDSYGFVYFHAKTFKGQLKRQAFWLLKQYANVDRIKNTNYASSFLKSFEMLFGAPNNDEKKVIEGYVNEYKQKWKGPGLMLLSNLELDKAIRDYFINLQRVDDKNGYYRISPHDLIEAQTNIRTNIQIDGGIVKDKMFNSFHTVKDGLVFYSIVDFNEKIDTPNSSFLLKDLSRIIRSFRRIGAGIHRGRGEIEAHLLLQEEDICCGSSGSNREEARNV